VVGSPQTVKVIATNAGHDSTVKGRVWIQGVDVAATDAVFSWTFPGGEPAPATVVRAPGYHDAPLIWNLTNPSLTMRIAVRPAGTTINSADWKVVLQPGNTTVATLNGREVKTPLPVPPPNQVVSYDVYCTVDLTDQYNNQYKLTISHPNAGVAHIGWTGKPLTANFHIAAATSDPATYQLIFYNVEPSAT
jgi:hypothetical protein